MNTNLKFTLYITTFLTVSLLQSLIFISKSNAQKKVFVIEMKQEIDPRTERSFTLALSQAQDAGVDLVLIDMDTFGGRVNNADMIVSQILAFKKPVYVYINKNAASAGAWISLACDKIYMADGASIGATTVVQGDGQVAPDKYQSYMRGKMRSTAEANGRDPKIAEAMVDPDIFIDGIIASGKVITFTAEEAVKHGYCEGKVKSLKAILAKNNIKDYTITKYEVSNLEKVINTFLNPYLSGILLLIILGGIYFELQTPGVGFPILAALIASVLYFMPYYLNGLAENWEVALFVIGLALLAVEAFVIPGFGVAGIAGLTASFGALMLMMLNNVWFDFSTVLPAQITNSLITIGIGLLGTILLIFWGMPKLLQSRRFQRISLQSSMNKEDGYNANTYTKNLIGQVGKAHTVLRPSGKIMIADELYDAYTSGDFIDKDSDITVVSQEGTSLKVRVYN